MNIEYVLTNPLLVEHVAPVFTVLEQRGVRSRLVCSAPGRLVQRRRAKLEVYERCIAAVQAAGLPYSSAGDPDADVALSALGANELHLYRGIKLKLRYGVSLHRAAIHHNAAMTRGFDGILAHGDFERDLFSRWIARERIARVGMPRHAAYLARPLTKADARAQLGVGGVARPVIAYFPTWAAQSSLTSFADVLSALATEYCVLIKPHALSFANPQEGAALARLSRAGARIIDARSPLFAAVGAQEPRSLLTTAADAQQPVAPLRAAEVDQESFTQPTAAGVFAPLTAAADLVIADATSGAATEAALLAPDTPLMLLSVGAPNELFREVEQLGPIVREAHALLAQVQRQLHADEYRRARKQLCSRLFYTEHAGPHAAELAADAILDLARLPKISSMPTRFERAWPQIARIARGRAITLGTKWAPLPPRDISRGA